ncbi:MAG: tRNA pseudouridine(13) synthase TruD [Candidatus Asgardarchaeum sp.]
MKVHILEQILGIKTYLTKIEGIGGILRKYISDFVVDEILLNQKRASSLGKYSEEKKNGNYTHFVFKKVNWATIEAIKFIARKLKISHKRFSYAGNKDKRAIAFQVGSVYNVKPSLLIRKFHPNLEVLNAWLADKPIRLGQLWGNFFRIIVRDFQDSSNIEEHLRFIYNELQSLGGVPNFFGHQRFGVQRPITHIVGKYILKGDYEKAVKTLLGDVFELEGSDAKEARIYLVESGWNYRKAISKFPNRLKTEIRLMQYLIKHPDDYLGALKSLPLTIFKIFIHAYQSYIFNESLSYRIAEGYPLNIAIEGDIVLQVDDYGLPISFPYIVTSKNIERVNELIRKRKLVIAHPIIGYKSVLPQNKIGDFYEKMLIHENVDKSNFLFKDLPELSSKGTYRQILAPIYWQSEPKIIATNNNINYIEFNFSLQKSSYATIVMREFMKTHPRNYV